MEATPPANIGESPQGESARAVLAHLEEEWREEGLDRRPLILREHAAAAVDLLRKHVPKVEGDLGHVRVWVACASQHRGGNGPGPLLQRLAMAQAQARV